MIYPEQAWRSHIKSAIFCDDVRKEIYGKDILIGVYTSNISIPFFPQQIKMVGWIEYVPQNEGQTQLRIKMEFSSQTQEIILRFDVVKKETAIPLFTPPFVFTALEQGYLRMSVSENAGEYNLVHQMEIMVAEFQQPIIPSPSPTF